MNGTTSWDVWQRMPDDGPASVAKARAASPEPPVSKRGVSRCGSLDSYGCVDWFDFELHRDGDGHDDGDGHGDGDEDRRRREARGVPI